MVSFQRGLGGLVILTALLRAVPALGDDGGCHTIDAQATGYVTSQSATETDTVSQISGGIIQGTTTARLSPTGFDSNTGVETYVATFVITTRHGTLTLHLFDGVLNTHTGEFANQSIVIDGTGRFENATGHLCFHGFVAADGTFIDDEISGEICLDD